MYLEPVGPATVSRARLGHPDEEAFSQTAGLARGAVFLIDDALAAVLTLGDAVQVVVGSSEEGLQHETRRSISTSAMRVRIKN